MRIVAGETILLLEIKGVLKSPEHPPGYASDPGTPHTLQPLYHFYYNYLQNLIASLYTYIIHASPTDKMHNVCPIIIYT